MSVATSTAVGFRATHAGRWRRHASIALMFASGFAGLGYQIVWTQRCALWLGHESAAVLAVVGAFFGGLALGGAVFGPAIERSVRPARWYAACEGLIAVWSLALVAFLPTFGDALLALTGLDAGPFRQWGIAFIGTFVLLSPATIAMGATLPAVERMALGLRTERRSIGVHYASNTLGAFVGVLATAFWMIPTLGLARTTLVCAALNLSCVLLALAFLDRLRARPCRSARARVAATPRRILFVLAATGFLGIGYEVLVVRVLGQLMEGTVYSFALLLAVYLVGNALGAGLAERRRGVDSIEQGDRAMALLAVACLVGIAILHGAERLRDGLAAILPTGLAASIGVEALLAVAVFALPTIAMGAVFAGLTRRAHAQGASFGAALAANTLGAALAPLVFGVALVTTVGTGIALASIVVGYLALLRPRAWATPIVWAPAVGCAALTLWMPTLAFVDVPAGGRIASFREGVAAAVSVVVDADEVASLRIDNREQEGTSATAFVDGRQALLPLLLHPAPRRALFLGLGTGVTARTAAADPTLAVDAVELVPEVVDASRLFARDDDPGTARLHVVAADARRFVRATDRRYDVIVADNIHPARSGTGMLYTVEHDEAVRRALAPDGVFCQWLPLHQLDLATLRHIVRSFLVAFPDARAILVNNSLDTPVVGLIGARADTRVDVATLRRRLAETAVPLADFGIDDEFALLGSFVAGPEALRRFARDVDANTDDRPVVAYRAPHVTYDPTTRPRDRLQALLEAWSVAPDDVVSRSADAATKTRLAAYWSARDAFIAAGRDVRPVNDPAQMLAQVERPLLDVLARSPDFRPAYDPLLGMADALARRDPDGARRLLAALVRVQPARPEAAVALSRLGP